MVRLTKGFTTCVTTSTKLKDVYKTLMYKNLK